MSPLTVITPREGLLSRPSYPVAFAEPPRSFSSPSVVRILLYLQHDYITLKKCRKLNHEWRYQASKHCNVSFLPSKMDLSYLQDRIFSGLTVRHLRVSCEDANDEDDDDDSPAKSSYSENKKSHESLDDIDIVNLSKLAVRGHCIVTQKRTKHPEGSDWTVILPSAFATLNLAAQSPIHQESSKLKIYLPDGWCNSPIVPCHCDNDPDDLHEMEFKREVWPLRSLRIGPWDEENGGSRTEESFSLKSVIITILKTQRVAKIIFFCVLIPDLVLDCSLCDQPMSLVTPMASDQEMSESSDDHLSPRGYDAQGESSHCDAPSSMEELFVINSWLKEVILPSRIIKHGAACSVIDTIRNNRDTYDDFQTILASTNYPRPVVSTLTQIDHLEYFGMRQKLVQMIESITLIPPDCRDISGTVPDDTPLDLDSYEAMRDNILIHGALNL